MTALEATGHVPTCTSRRLLLVPPPQKKSFHPILLLTILCGTLFFFSPTEYVNIHQLVPVQLSLTGRVQLVHLFSTFQVVFGGFFLQENGNQVLGNDKLIVFLSKRQREEQAKSPMSGAAFTATHAQSSTGRSDTLGLGVFAKPIPKHTS